MVSIIMAMAKLWQSSSYLSLSAFSWNPVLTGDDLVALAIILDMGKCLALEVVLTYCMIVGDMVYRLVLKILSISSYRIVTYKTIMFGHFRS